LFFIFNFHDLLQQIINGNILLARSVKFRLVGPGGFPLLLQPEADPPLAENPPLPA
jgi:hypothetical protein